MWKGKNANAEEKKEAMSQALVGTGVREAGECEEQGGKEMEQREEAGSDTGDAPGRGQGRLRDRPAWGF